MDNKEKNGRSVGGLRDQMSGGRGGSFAQHEEIYVYIHIYIRSGDLYRERTWTRIQIGEKKIVYTQNWLRIYTCMSLQTCKKKNCYDVALREGGTVVPEKQ